MPRPEFVLLDQMVSSSDRRTVHEIRRGHDGVTYCTCTAWRMKQGRASCKHLDDYLLRNQPLHRAGARETIAWATVRVGTILECNSRGVVFLLKVSGCTYGMPVQGEQLLDQGSIQISLRGERLVAMDDVVRIVVR